MKLHNYLRPDLVLLDLDCSGVEDTLRCMVRTLFESGVIEHEDTVFQALLEREAAQSTGIGGGVAIPHAVCPELESTVLELALSREGIDFRALDDEPVHSLFLLLSPPSQSSTHIKLLARIARLMRQPDFQKRMLEASSPEAIIETIRRVDEEHP